MPRTPLVALTAIVTFLAASTAEAQSQPGEAEFQQAMGAMKRLQNTLQRIETLKDSKSRDDRLLAALDTAQVRYYGPLQRSAELGHPLAAYYWAGSLAPHAGMSGDKQDQACNLLEEAAGNGLLAAAVARFQKCDKAFARFIYDDPEHLRIVRQLAKAEAGQDPERNRYPLPMSASLCFPAPTAVKVAGTDVKAAPPKQASYDDFRAEANLLLGMAGMVDPNANPNQTLAHFQVAQRLGCRLAGKLSKGMQASVRH